MSEWGKRMNCCIWQWLRTRHNVPVSAVPPLAFDCGRGIYVAVDPSCRAAHLPRAAATGTDSQTLQIANVALNGKWMKLCSYTDS